MRTRLKLLLLILSFVLLYATYYWGIPAFVDIGHKIPVIQKFAKERFGAEIELKNPKLKMGLTPSIWLEADYLGITEKKYSPLSTVNPKIKVQLIPLLWGKVNVAYFSCDDMKADLKIDKNYRIYIGNIPFVKSSNPIFSIEDSSMEIGKYQLDVNDEIQNQKIDFDGEYLEILDYNSKKHIGLSTNSRIKIGNQVSTVDASVDLKLPLKKGFNTNEIVFDGSIANFNLAYLSPYVKKMSKNKVQKLTGILDMDARTKDVNIRTSQIFSQIVLHNFSVLTGNKATSVFLNDKLRLNVDLNVSKNLLLVKNLSASSGKMNVDLQGKIRNIESKNPKLDLTLNVDKSRIENFVALLPDENIKNLGINIPAVKKYGFYSDVEGKIKVRGSFDKPNIMGDIIAQNAYVQKPLNIPKATVKMKFLGAKFLLDVTVPMNNNEKITVKGPIELYRNKDVILDIASTQNVDLGLTKTILDPLHEMFYFDIGPVPYMQLSGYGNIKLKTGGTNEAPKLWGVLNFKNAKGNFNGVNLPIENFDGSVYFNNRDTHFVTRKALLDKKPIKIDGKCSLRGDLDFDVIANGQSLNTLVTILNNSPKIKEQIKTLPDIKTASGKINMAIKLKGKVQSVDDFTLGKNILASGSVKLLGNNIFINNLNVSLNNLFGVIKFKNSDADLDLYSNFNKSKIIIKGKVRDNKIHSKVKLDNIKFTYANIPVRIFSGNLEINNDKLILYKINGLLDTMPVLVDGFVTDIFKKPHFNVYINSKPNQKFIDQYVNKDSIYPLKMKGDVIYSSRINGTRDSLNVKTEINLQTDSNIYYMGSTLGDANNPIRIFLDANVAKNSILVNNFQYDKLISSQNDKEFISHQLNASGLINLNKKNIALSNFKIRTQNPTDSKIFNIMFKKPLIKEGLFSSNITLNGIVNAPKIIGSLNFSGVNIPLLDTTIKDISLDFSKNDIDIKAKGEVFSNKIVIFAGMNNKLTPPYTLKDVDIYLGNLDVNEISRTINKLDLESSNASLPNQPFDIKDLVIKNGKIRAESVFVKTLLAKDLSANFSLSDKLLFSLDNFKFNVAEGNIEGDYAYNLLNSKTDLSIIVDNVNANSMAESLFDLPNQIYGSLSGQAHITCNAKTHKTCMNTLSGKGGFRVANGRMPKLGSLEYLLKAANLVKSGVTGVTLNSFIDLITPLKTGQFENINGMFSIDSGLATDIQIFSKGKDLSLFLTGTYNFSTLVANMEIFGRLSKKMTNILGPVGNTSLNTLFNTIPGLHLEEANNTEFLRKLNKIPGFELNDTKYRIFSVEIYGDINGDNYVKSFKWVE